MRGDSHEPIDLTSARWISSLPTIRARLAMHGRVALRIPTEAIGRDAWRGEERPDGVARMGLRDWLDLADALEARLSGPLDEPGTTGATLLFRLDRLGPETEVHGRSFDDRYGRAGSFGRVNKAGLPGFRLPLLEALAFARDAETRPDGRVLVVGCHRGDELEVLAASDPPVAPDRVVGVDRNAEALDEARMHHREARFVEAELATLADGEALPVDGRFDLIVAIAVLQSSGLDGPAVLRGLIRHHAAEHGGVVIGVPASRFRDGEVVWGARTRNFRQTDLSLVVRDLAGHRRYLHQHGYRTRIAGRYDLLLAGRR